MHSLQGLAAIACALMMTVGCASWFGVEPAYENKLVVHYNQLAESISQLDPSVESPLPSPSLGMGRELVPPRKEDRWSLSLTEAIRIALQNNKIIRQNAQFMSPNNPVMQSPDMVPSVFDPAIQNTGVLFGSRGTDAALSDFDPRLTVTSKWANDQTVANTTNLAPPENILETNSTQVQARLEQQLLGGGVIALNQNWNYTVSNQPLQLFSGAYTSTLGAELRQPLWAGSGKEYTAIAGPATQRARGFSNVSQGIVIAQINKRLSEIDLQENLQNLVREIGDLYWDLYQNYQDYDYEHSNAEVAEQVYETINIRKYQESGVDVAQAEDSLYEAKGREDLALSNLYATEGKLRRLLGLPLDDSRMIFPSDPPREEELKFNRAMCLYEALCNRLELTRQKTQLHSYQLQLSAARKLIAPKLDFVAGASLNGFGQNFLRPDSDNFNSATSNLLSGKETSWSSGFEYSIPLWLRQEKAQVHQLEFKVMKARMALASQEDEIAHELNSVLLTISKAQRQAKDARLRVQAATRRVNAAKHALDGGTKNSDQFWRALSSRTQARSAYTRSVNEYNKALRDLLFRTGRILPADGIAVVGVDGLPLMSPSNPELPFDGLRNPGDPSPMEPEMPELPEPEDLDKKPEPKPKKDKTPVANGDSGSLSATDDFEPPVVRDDSEPESVQNPAVILPVNFFEEEHPTDGEFRAPIVTEPDLETDE